MALTVCEDHGPSCPATRLASDLWVEREDASRPGTPDGEAGDWYAASDYEGELALWLDLGGEA